MKTTMYDVEYYVNVAKAIFDQQTGEELNTIKTHFGAAYNEAKLVALIAVKMFVRIVGLQEESPLSRDLSPVEQLVDRAMQNL